ncbi:phage major capsid protein [Sulfitobacter pseudonitzschiae]|uniref:Phage major capsid protein n=1 Tax=Pseudosulfitobacter pseudonitzschiae TaxID=1402135 RepID=A0A9Q2P3K3_9RHOB|nr:phage major capsid protein [Pseudosulfitobacter pseudonitzschiae]MBM2293758.1 phage major capsid protein [Pseudosulfitobacter pseudonitzschiae]MBM2298676.1 phage major capsid protein [Pseudosulfitobacter pseudonitzschiae]MBM2303590.1 phage major capsid protein [Pseudosulfitobacter pseudonitzschiae]MBM2313373.1 phage major capsid protein [Pseudosulfitobacter pseudonitzschiae]MBM2318286.1 phage major capsid protein [Pseudosulfitobacter pseudonitzschiae]
MTKHYTRNAFETKNDDVDMDAIMREVKGFGANVTELKTSMLKDLDAVRKMAEEAKGISPELEAKFTEITTSVAAKNQAIEDLEKKTSEQYAQMETALSRMPAPGQGSDNEALAVKQAIEFFETKQASKGSLNWADRPTADNIDLDGYKAWEQNFEGYLRVDENGLGDQERKSLTVGRNPNGGYFVPTAMSTRIIQKIWETSQLRQMATVETISTESLDVRIDRDEADCEWAGEETVTGDTGTPGVGLQNIPVHEMRAKPKISQNMLEDAAIDVEAWLANKVAEKMGRKEATAFIIGNGIKKPRGILTYPDGSGDQRGTVKQYISGAATGVTSDAIVGMPYRLKTAYMQNASWLMNRLTVLSVMLLKDNDGQYLWRPGLAEGRPSTLGGHAISMADDMPLLAANSLSVAFGDWRRAYTVVDRLGLTTLRDPFSAKPFVEYYTRKRVGGDVTDFEAYALLRTEAA